MLYPFTTDPMEELKPIAPPLRHEEPIRELVFVDDRTLLITTSEASVKVWNALSGALRKVINGQFIRPLAFSNGVGSGRFATVDAAGKVVTLWDADTLDAVAAIRPEGPSRLIGAGLLDNGKTLATVSEDHSVTLRDVAEGRPFATLRPPSPAVNRVFDDEGWLGFKPRLQLDDPFRENVSFLIPTEKAEKK